MNNGSTYAGWNVPRVSGPITCASCGCRLAEAPEAEGYAWRHFPSLTPGRDARGCRPSCVDEPHGRDGHVRDGFSALAALVRDRDAAVRVGPAGGGADEDPR